MNDSNLPAHSEAITRQLERFWSVSEPVPKSRCADSRRRAARRGSRRLIGQSGCDLDHPRSFFLCRQPPVGSASVDEMRKILAQPGKQIPAIHPGLLRERVERVGSERVCGIALRDGGYRSAALALASSSLSTDGFVSVGCTDISRCGYRFAMPINTQEFRARTHKSGRSE